MNTRAQTPRSAVARLSFTSVQPQLLQRKCACGGSSNLAGECKECASKRLQRSSLAQGKKRIEEGETAPPIVHEVLRSPGSPLDGTTRAFMESRFGHDFSRVRVHTDARAVESAHAVTALAYTVGRDIVFGDRQYTARTTLGDRLLAHELTHVVQQEHDNAGVSTELRLSHPGENAEQEADRVADQAVSGTFTVFPRVGGEPGLLQRQPVTGAQSSRPWNANLDITAGLISTCWSDVRANGQYVSEYGPGPYSSICPPLCAREPLPLRLLFHVDGDTIPRPQPFDPSRLAATASFLPSSGGPESLLVQAIGKGAYDGPGAPLLTNIRTDLRFFTPPETGALLINLINSDPSSGVVAVYTDKIPVVDCPRSPRTGIAVPRTAVEVGIWLVVADPENAPLQYQRVDKNTPLEDRGVLVSVFRDESGYFYTYNGRRVYLPERP